MIDVFKEIKLHTITITYNSLPLQVHTIHYHYKYIQYITITSTYNTLPLQVHTIHYHYNYTAINIVHYTDIRIFMDM